MTPTDERRSTCESRSNEEICRNKTHTLVCCTLPGADRMLIAH
jgi:hypothetical protein